MEFAARELDKYEALLGISVSISLSVDADAFDAARFWHFDPRLDDAFSVRVKDAKGSIVATNERAVLIGVYHYLVRQGCRFLHPGKGGELIPRIDTPTDVDETWYASVRHRGTTSMGLWTPASGIDGVLDFIDFLPKVAMNTFFNELEDYYSIVENAYKREGVPFSRESYAQGHQKTLAALKARHILYHNAGHGWTTRMMKGIEKLGFDEDDTPCENTEILALTGGKRKIFQKKPLFTNLCYSNEEVRKGLARLVLAYAEAHPETDFIHVWLADFYGNFCECERCRQKRPSDHYVAILNEIDRLLTAAGSKQKVVFLIYFELMYAPLFERLNDPERFVMLFCPYGRNFLLPYRDTPARPYAPKLSNDFSESDMDMGLYLAQLRDWKRIYGGDSIIFDYTFYDGTYFQNLFHVDFAEIPHLNCKDMKEYGLNGRIECGHMRAHFPTAFPLYAMANETFYGNTDYALLRREYFESAYGVGEPISAFLEEAARTFPNALRADFRFAEDSSEKAAVDRLAERVKAFRASLASYMPSHSAQRENVRCFCGFLTALSTYLRLLLAAFEEKSKDVLTERLDELRQMLRSCEQAFPATVAASRTHLFWGLPFYG